MSKTIVLADLAQMGATWVGRCDSDHLSAQKRSSSADFIGERVAVLAVAGHPLDTIHMIQHKRQLHAMHAANFAVPKRRIPFEVVQVGWRFICLALSSAMVWADWRSEPASEAGSSPDPG